MTQPKTPDDQRRLYGIDDAEHLYFTLAEAYETQVDGQEGNEPQVIKEWTVQPASSLIPAADSIIERLVEQITDVPEGFYDDMEGVEADLDVLAAVEALREAFASRMTFYLADKMVAEHTITWDDQGENPMDCGQPIYVASAS